ncbi:efflux RND transporter permease subunit [Vitiosangium sp. GDMCC 1.1324]|uniref:efflux RND transporter permease subunit n=1 Tax=Vitiosangium sp. (strain GDMCC 1.1324) TaxID=2138576 RepID=UPI000D3AC95D|nr:efflux RND transporter permease subunit [Vitiosangium sp. GDMCC 1.1324]PTL78079.1 hydrophobe/amphiphile efflux-1 family RND transporter [Vitiosangium sp. GDMCC 1.1324]
MARFFIDRPIFAWVIAIIIMLGGALAILGLPVAQYPAIAPPIVSISAFYPGASAKTLEDTVTQVIEQKMNGLDHLRYMASSSDSAGNVTISLTFDAGTDPDIAQVQVQNKLQTAMALLPMEVQKQGLRVNKAVNNFLMIIGFTSADGSMNRYDLADYVASNVQDQLARVSGVGEVQLFGGQYAMRIWLNPDRLTSYKLTPADVSAAIQVQNAQVSAGQLGGAPSIEGQQLNATVTAQSRLQTPEQFRDILLRVNPDGSQVRLRDVARVELSGESFAATSNYNGKPATAMAIKLATGANALDVATAVRARVDELAKFFPSGMQVVYPMDTTPFVRLSIKEVIKTLIEAIILVFIVMYLFLQNFRATLIPAIAAPVVLLGTFGVLAVAGYSINTLTMFGMVLAIGLLVDDAIVVVENVERVMSEEGLSPKEAARKSMGQITGALVGVTSVLSAVFVPMAFFGGSVGVIYRQFSITIVSSMVLSVLVAMTLTPALCATLLAPVAAGHGHERRGFFGWFNRAYERGSHKYQGLVGVLLGRAGRSMLVYVAIVGVMSLLLVRLPTAFLPDEDLGFVFTMVQLPPNATLEKTTEVLQKVSDHYLTQEKDAVESVMAIGGFSFGGRGQNAGLAFVKLKDWSERESPALKAKALVGRAMGVFSQIKEGMVFAFVPPAVQELGNATGFDLQLQDRGELGHDKLIAARNQLLGLAARHPALAKVRPNGLDDAPQYRVDIDQEKAAALRLSLADINSTLSSAWGGTYVNDFIDRGRVKKVFMQADAPYRMQPEDVNRWYVRNALGEMVPFSAFASGEWTYGSPKLERFNGLPSVEILGEAAPGYSSGEAMRAMEELVQQLPPGIGYEWTGMSYEERLSGSQAPALYAISLLVVFLCLAALYESWSIPASVMLVVPLGVLGALVAALMGGLSNDVYFQVGLLTTIGLSAKNAILIIEFAKDLYEQGRSLKDAALDAVRMRLRPIIMTSLAFILGVLPLALASGAGSGSQNAIGIGVIGGMVSGTVLAVFLVPVFFVVILRRFSRAPTAAPQVPATAGGTVHG